MEINDLLQETFLAEWNRLTSRSISSQLPIIKENFAITNVRSQINENINESVDKTTRERYHRQNLAELARIYAQTLYTVSESGINVNSFTIREAKAQMKNKGKCDAYPC
jgi:hypothetical protein